ncbi:hypothetical protein ACFLY9_01325 [Patescibacteria group bacterium]
MKIKVRFKISNELYTKTILPTKEWFMKFKKSHPYRFYISVFSISLVLLTFLFKINLSDKLFVNATDVINPSNTTRNTNVVSIENDINNSNQDVLGISTKKHHRKVRSDVGFIDLRILTLEDFFTYYESPLIDYSDEFIEACERYNVENWQLLPAIALAETLGCRTGISHEQRNCWGWGGSGRNRWEFDSYEEAIDLITHRMINGYGNERMNARDIQSTYCGSTCMEWGWRWAKGVNNYTMKINDFGEKYGLPRTNEIQSYN